MEFATSQVLPRPLYSRLAVWPICYQRPLLETETMMSNDGLIDEIASRMNQEEILEVLDLEMDVLLEALRDHICDNRGKFNDYLEIDE